MDCDVVFNELGTEIDLLVNNPLVDRDAIVLAARKMAFVMVEMAGHTKYKPVETHFALLDILSTFLGCRPQ